MWDYDASCCYICRVWYGRCLSCILSLYRLCYFLISKVSKRKGWIFARKKMPHSSRRGWNKVELVKRKVKDELGMCLMMVTSMYWIWASLERREWSNGDQIGKRNSCVPVPVATDRGWDKISGDLTCKWGLICIPDGAPKWALRESKSIGLLPQGLCVHDEPNQNMFPIETGTDMRWRLVYLLVFCPTLRNRSGGKQYVCTYVHIIQVHLNLIRSLPFPLKICTTQYLSWACKKRYGQSVIFAGFRFLA